MDPAELILEGALEQHAKMINQFKGFTRLDYYSTKSKTISQIMILFFNRQGVPGVLPERLAEGMSPVHCALSLVGEPIMYPEINRFLKMLHERNISSFLVTNAQLPDAIRQLEPCTQLYELPSILFNFFLLIISL